MTDASLIATGVSVSRGGRTVVRNISLEIVPGTVTAIIGPNGSGKSTLLSALAGMLSPATGLIECGGRPITMFTAAERARRIAYLPQTRTLAWPVSVRTVVALGRYAYGASPSRLSPADAAAVNNALADCGLEALADRPADALSGGEAARMHLARTLATGAPILLVDEPAANLDPRHQLEVAALLKRHAKADAPAAVVVVMHDLALAARIADRLVCLNDGAAIADGPPERALTTDLLRAAFGVDGDVSHADGVINVRIDAPSRG